MKESNLVSQHRAPISNASSAKYVALGINFLFGSGICTASLGKSQQYKQKTNDACSLRKNDNATTSLSPIEVHPHTALPSTALKNPACNASWVRFE